MRGGRLCRARCAVRSRGRLLRQGLARNRLNAYCSLLERQASASSAAMASAGTGSPFMLERAGLMLYNCGI